MTDPSRERAHQAWRSAQKIRKLSDGMFKVGPWGVGLDGMLAWVPGVGTAYSLGAGGLLLYEASQCGASKATLGKMAGWLAADTAFSGVPLVGWAIDTFFRGHRMAARELQRDIERRHGRPVLHEGLGGRSASAMRDVTPRRS
ncbi:DUF4112 domain-containing protein [Phenylobacterium sp.]|jgi:hypothetical protein|uniref:DUF4112 domain-containing protein n=1 Tax=Phenylobacterium sp. TaxID=1871053 RepID=UPI002F944BA2